MTENTRDNIIDNIITLEERELFKRRILESAPERELIFGCEYPNPKGKLLVGQYDKVILRTGEKVYIMMMRVAYTGGCSYKRYPLDLIYKIIARRENGEVQEIDKNDIKELAL